jgi:hypothetical protein
LVAAGREHTARIDAQWERSEALAVAAVSAEPEAPVPFVQLTPAQMVQVA